MTKKNLDTVLATNRLSMIADSVLPLEVNSVKIESDGRISSAALDRTSFCFEYFGILFRVQIEATDDAAKLSFMAKLGPLPYSMQSSATRANALLAIAAANRFLEDARIKTGTDQQMRLMGIVEAPRPLTAVALLVAVAEFILHVKPALDLMGLILSEPAAQASPVAGPEQIAA